MPFTLGIDYGSNSVRTIVVDVKNGRELESAIADYPSGKQGILLDPRGPHVARQHPGDYLFGLEKTGHGALADAERDDSQLDHPTAAPALLIESATVGSQ